MNDLQTIEKGIRKTAELFGKIRSFEDIETYLLRGQGLSAGTYRVYMVAIRQLYEFTGGLSPFQVEPAHIERFYDHVRQRVDISTAYNKIAGLKRFFATVAKTCPGFVSPFDEMDPELVRKLSKTKRGERKTALYDEEVKAVLGYLEGREDRQSRTLYAVIHFLLATGLRVSELCALSWKDVEYDPDRKRWYCVGIGKGDKPFHQEIARTEALDKAREYCRNALRREPRPSDALFWTSPRYPSEKAERLNPAALRYMLRILGRELEEEGIITRRLEWSPHLFRRTAGTMLDRHGMSVVGIQRFLRHANINTTVQHYIDNTESAAGYFAEAMG